MKNLLFGAVLIGCMTLLVNHRSVLAQDEQRVEPRRSYVPSITFQFDKFSIQLGLKNNGRGGLRLNVPRKNIEVEVDSTLTKNRRLGVKFIHQGQVLYNRDHQLSEPPPPPLPEAPSIELGEESGFDDEDGKDLGSELDKEFANPPAEEKPKSNVPPAPDAPEAEEAPQPIQKK